MCFTNVLILVATFVVSNVALAQIPTHNLGRAPSEEEIRSMDTIVGPRGKELPPGKGTAKDGGPLFVKKCVACHGRNGEGSKIASQIIGGAAIYTYPFATTIWSYIYHAMPRNPAVIGLRQEALTADEVYALTAFILYKDNVIKEDDVMDAQSLPRVHMPNRSHYLDGLAPPADDAKR